MIARKEERQLYKWTSYCSGTQLILIILFSVIMVWVGPRPETAVEAFNAFDKGVLYGLLKDELLVILMVSLYLVTFSGIFVALFQYKFTLALLGTLFTFVAVILVLSAQSAFSLYHLSNLFSTTSDPIVKERLIAAGDAVIAKNIWHSTSAYFSGFLMQGGGILVSIAMIGHKDFRRMTVLSGILGNGLDLIQHAIHLSLPAIASPILMLAGPFYLIWYFMLASDFMRLSKKKV